MLDKRKFYINGKWISPFKPNDFEVINPSNENPYAIISLGYKEDVDAAVIAAKNAFIDEKIMVLLIFKSRAASNKIRISPLIPSIFNSGFWVLWFRISKENRLLSSCNKAPNNIKIKTEGTPVLSE